MRQQQTIPHEVLHLPNGLEKGEKGKKRDRNRDEGRSSGLALQRENKILDWKFVPCDIYTCKPST